MANMIKPAIIVIAYNREESLKRLLTSLNNAIYESDDITLIISIDKSDNEKVYKDVLIYRNGYKLTELDNSFITAVCNSKRQYITLLSE